jgi:hypothetical protein
MYKVLSDVERKNCVGVERYLYTGEGILKEKERKRELESMEVKVCDSRIQLHFKIQAELR